MAKWFRRKKKTEPSEPLASWGPPTGDGPHAPRAGESADERPDPDSPDPDPPSGPWIAFYHALADPHEADRVRAFARSFAETPKAQIFGVEQLATANDELTQIVLSDSQADPPDLALIAEQWLSLIRSELKPDLDQSDYVGVSHPDPSGGTRMLTASHDLDCPGMLLIERVRVDAQGNPEPITPS